MDNVEIKPSTRKDIQEFYGNKMRDTCRAWSVFYYGELVCIAGVAITRNLMLVFMEIKSDVDAPDITVWRGALKVWKKIKDIGYPLMYSIADPNHPNASNFLKRLGFKHAESSVRGEIYIWQTQ